MLNVDTNRIGAIIAQSGLTYADVADEAGITRATFSCVMKRGTARVLTLGKIAKALGVDATEILQK